MDEMEYNFFYVAMAISGLAALFFFYGISRYRLKKHIEYTPTSKAVSVAPGLVELVGRARPGGEPQTAFFSQAPCAYCYAALFKWVSSGDSATKVFVKDWESKSPFLLEDETGRVDVFPDYRKQRSLPWKMITPAAIFTKKNEGTTGNPGQGLLTRLTGLGKHDENDALHQFLRANYPSLIEYNNRIDIEETILRDGDPLYVLGEARMVESPEPGRARVIVENTGRVFCLARGTEKDALNRIGVENTFFTYLSPLVIGAFSLGVLVTGIKHYPNIKPYFFPGNPVFLYWGVIGIIVSLFLFFCLIFLRVAEVYNGTILLRNNIGRAKSNTEALLNRRAKLVPELAATVSASARHEKKLQGMISDLRAAPIGLSAVRAQAISEAYPALRAGENFLKFQQQLEQTEEWIAGSRHYINDSILLYNRQITTFPGIFVAWIKGFKPMSYGGE